MIAQAQDDYYFSRQVFLSMTFLKYKVVFLV